MAAPTAADVKTRIQEVVTNWETGYMKKYDKATNTYVDDTTRPAYKTLSTERLYQYVAFKGFLTTP